MNNPLFCDFKHRRPRVLRGGCFSNRKNSWGTMGGFCVSTLIIDRHLNSPKVGKSLNKRGLRVYWN